MSRVTSAGMGRPYSNADYWGKRWTRTGRKKWLRWLEWETRKGKPKDEKEGKSWFEIFCAPSEWCTTKKDRNDRKLADVEEITETNVQTNERINLQKGKAEWSDPHGDEKRRSKRKDEKPRFVKAEGAKPNRMNDEEVRNGTPNTWNRHVTEDTKRWYWARGQRFPRAIQHRHVWWIAA
jgi:hypothetical protein